MPKKSPEDATKRAALRALEQTVLNPGTREEQTARAEESVNRFEYEQKVMEVVRLLRFAIGMKELGRGMTQTEFAARLGLGMSTVQRYEQVVPPRGRALWKLMDLADNCLGADVAYLSRFFKTALSKDLADAGEPTEHLESMIAMRRFSPAPATLEEQILTTALLYIVRQEGSGEAPNSGLRGRVLSGLIEGLEMLAADPETARWYLSSQREESIDESLAAIRKYCEVARRVGVEKLGR